MLTRDLFALANIYVSMFQYDQQFSCVDALWAVSTRKLATKTDRASVCIRFTKNFGQGRAGGVIDPVEIFLTSSLITMQNLRVVSICCVRACGRSHKFWGRRGPAPHNLRHVADP